MLEHNLLAVIVDLIDRVNHGLHALDGDTLHILQLPLQFDGLLQRDLVLPEFDDLTVQSEGYFILIEIVHEGEVLVAHSVLDEPCLFILLHLLITFFHHLKRILVTFSFLCGLHHFKYMLVLIL